MFDLSKILFIVHQHNIAFFLYPLFYLEPRFWVVLYSSSARGVAFKYVVWFGVEPLGG